MQLVAAVLIGGTVSGIGGALLYAAPTGPCRFWRARRAWGVRLVLAGLAVVLVTAATAPH